MATGDERDVLMTRQVPVRPRPERTSGPVSFATDFALPADLLEKARFRMRKLALVFVCLSTLALALAVANVLRDDVVGTKTGARLGVWVHGILLVIELALFVVARSQRLSDRTALHFALVWEVAMCVVISGGESEDPPGGPQPCLGEKIGRPIHAERFADVRALLALDGLGVAQRAGGGQGPVSRLGRQVAVEAGQAQESLVR